MTKPPNLALVPNLLHILLITGTKTFPWPVNPLGPSGLSTNHHQNSINCFNTGSSSVASMSTTMLPGSMGSSLSGSGSAGGVGAPCPYTTPTNPYMYHHRTTAEPGTAMSCKLEVKTSFSSGELHGTT